MIYIVYGEVDYLLETRIATSLADRGAVSALHRMGLGILAEAGVEVLDVYGEVGAAVIEAPRERAEWLRARGLRVEEAKRVRALLKDSAPLVGAPKAWELGYTGRGIKIAVLDTGVSPTCGLEGKIAEQKSLVPGEGPEDLNGHGTHVAAIAASNDGEYRGVAPDASIINIKVLDSGGSGLNIVTARGIVEAMKMGADVVNLSLGVPGHPDDLLSRMVNLAASRGVVPVAAAGNDGPGRGTINSPGTAAHAITVGATDKRKKVTRYSSRGPVGDMIKPELVAPGGDVGQEIVASRPKDVTPQCEPVGECYMGCIGTSMAAPHVSGAAAVLLEAMGGRNRDRAFVVKQILTKTAEDLGLPKEEQGYGFLRIDKALEALKGEEATSATTAAAAFDLTAVLGAAALALTGLALLTTASRQNNLTDTLREMYRRGQVTLAQLVELYRRGVIDFKDLQNILGMRQ